MTERLWNRRLRCLSGVDQHTATGMDQCLAVVEAKNRALNKLLAQWPGPRSGNGAICASHGIYGSADGRDGRDSDLTRGLVGRFRCTP